MKRRYLTFLAALLIALPLGANSLGFSLGYFGRSVEGNPSLTTAGAEFSLVVKMWDKPVANPSLIARTSFGPDESGAFGFPYLQVGLGLDLFRMLNHPFTFLSLNSIAYAPMVGVSYTYDTARQKHLAGLEFSPIKLVQKDYWYEALAPFIHFDVSARRVDSWGFNIIRFTYLLK